MGRMPKFPDDQRAWIRFKISEVFYQAEANLYPSNARSYQPQVSQQMPAYANAYPYQQNAAPCPPQQPYMYGNPSYGYGSAYAESTPQTSTYSGWGQ